MHSKKSYQTGNTDEFISRILPDYIKENEDHIITGEKYHSIYAIREYPMKSSSTLLSEIGRMKDVNLKLYISSPSRQEISAILKNSIRKSKMLVSSNNISEKIEGKETMENIENMLNDIISNGHSLIYVSAFIDISSSSLSSLISLREKVEFVLTSKNIIYSKLLFRQREALMSTFLCGYNHFSQEFTRLLPDISVFNLYPFSSFGKYDSSGFYIGDDEFSGEIIDDITNISSDKTNSNVAILGNSGQGKSYLTKLLICNILESGKNAIIFDPENEYGNLTNNLGGLSLDSYQLSFNPLYIVETDENGVIEYDSHISFLNNFFSITFSFSPEMLSILERYIHSLYMKYGITRYTKQSEIIKYPTITNLYELINEDIENNSKKTNTEILSNILILLYPIAYGSMKRYFSYNSMSYVKVRLIRFDLKDIISLGGSIQNGILYNILHFASEMLLSYGNTALIIDELYLFLENKIALKEIRDNMKRVRKRNSLLLISTQNISDFLLDGIKEYTKPLLSIPQRKFLFSPGDIDKDKYIQALWISELEFSKIKESKMGRCLYKCGNDTFIMNVHAPSYKSEIF